MKDLQKELRDYLSVVATVKDVVLIQHTKSQLVVAIRTIFEAEYIINDYITKSRIGWSTHCIIFHSSD